MTIGERTQAILAKIEEIKASGDPETLKDMETALNTLGVTLDE